MEKIGFYAGSFDPFTVGHLRIFLEALCNYDKVIIAIGENPNKEHLFSAEERKELVHKSIDDAVSMWQDKVYLNLTYSASEEKALARLAVNKTCYGVISYNYLTIDAALAHGATSIIRGKRIVGDDADEMHQAMINRQLLAIRGRHLAMDIIPVPQESLTYISSSTFKNLCSLGEYIAAMQYVTPSVHNAAMKKYLSKYFIEAADRYLYPPISGVSSSRMKALFRAYQDRGYHNLSHLAYGINYFNIYCRHTQTKPEVGKLQFLVAWFYHDYVMQGDNPEEESIVTMQKHFGMEYAEIANLIRATKHTLDIERRSLGEQLINDIDMAILGDRANYSNYLYGLQQEVPPTLRQEYVLKRIAFLEQQMNVRTYELPFFEELFRDSARDNMQRELHCLRGYKSE